MVATEALYRLLEEEVVPAFYDRDASNVPRRWLRMLKEAIRSVTPHFSARRMLKQYIEEMYAPAASLSSLTFRQPEVNGPFHLP
jgi:starch phosphorylase